MNFAKEKAITLIALVVTIIITLILAGISLNLVLGRDGLINKSKNSKETYEKAAEREQLELVLNDAALEREGNKTYNENEFLNKFIKEKITTAQINENEVKVKKYTFLIDRQKLIIVSEIEDDITDDSTQEEPTSAQGLIQNVAKMKTSGNYKVEISGKKEDGTEDIVQYSINLITYEGDLKLDGNISAKGATLNENVYEFGNKEADVATETENARNMVVLKVNGNLTIDEGITLTACKSDDGYGGPKGLLIYCTGKLTNNGTISMTARGAKAEGENVFLWENANGTYEFVPSNGGNGGSSVMGYCNVRSASGLSGDNGVNRATGGGGSGSATMDDCGR